MPTALARPVQKFKPTAGAAIGYVGLAVCAFVVAVVATTEQHATGLQVGLGAVLVGVLIWLALLRPRATAYDDTLVLRGMVSDTALPLARIDAAVVRHMLVVRIGEDRYTCAGIARSSRGIAKRANPNGIPGLGLQRSEDRMRALGARGEIGSSGEYANFVESRIEELARSARRDGRDGADVRRRWAPLELAALVGSALAFLLSMLVL